MTDQRSEIRENRACEHTALWVSGSAKFEQEGEEIGTVKALGISNSYL